MKIAEVEAITWRIAERLADIYPGTIGPISGGPLFEDNPVLTRPDLPDPDTEGVHD
ncbi:MAG: hypothetical protein V2A76_13550 [Planctomycetota bacterium]